MPFAAQQKQTDRKPIDPKDTFSYTTPDVKVVAHPVDPFVKPADELGNLVDALKGLKGGLQAYAQYKEVKNKEDEEKGKLLRMGKQPMPESSSQALIRGYEEADGLARSYEYHNDLNNYFESAKDEDLPTFKKGLDEISNKYINGSSDNFLRGFAPRAMEFESHWLDQYTKHQTVQMQDKYKANARTIISQEMTRVGFENPRGMRDLVTDLQGRGKYLHLSNQDISELAFEEASASAVLYGDTRYLKWLAEPDKSGQTLVDVIGPAKVASAFKAAMNAAEERQTLQMKLDDRKKRETSENTSKDLWSKFVDLDKGSVEAITKFKQEVQGQKGNLEDQDFKPILAAVDGLSKGGFPTEGDDSVFRTTWNQIQCGKADADAIENVKGRLNATQYTALYNELSQQKVKIRDHSYQEYTSMRNHYYTKMIDVVDKKDPLLGSIYNDGPDKAKEANNEWYGRVQAKEQELGRQLNANEFNEISTQIIKETRPDANANLKSGYSAPPAQGSSSSNTNSSGGGTLSVPPNKGNIRDRLKGLSTQKPAAAEGEKSSMKAGDADMFKLSMTDYEPTIKEASTANGVDPLLIASMIRQESGGKANAVSPKGAGGVMQLMPETAKGLGVKDVFNPHENIKGGTRYLAQMMKRFNNNVVLALAAYNAGPEAVEKYGGVPPYKETREYVRNILGNYYMRKGMTT